MSDEVRFATVPLPRPAAALARPSTPDSSEKHPPPGPRPLLSAPPARVMLRDFLSCNYFDAGSGETSPALQRL